MHTCTRSLKARSCLSAASCSDSTCGDTWHHGVVSREGHGVARREGSHLQLVEVEDLRRRRAPPVRREQLMPRLRRSRRFEHELLTLQGDGLPRGTTGGEKEGSTGG